MNPDGDIVVTAQKRAQRLIDVPVPVTAVSADALTTQGVTKLSDFYDRVPGLQYAGGRTSNLSLRGITTGGVTAATVAILVDDVPFGGTTNAGQPPIPDFDPGTLDRVEVLRGPQGTLYGASSLGGLIKYVTRAPNTSEVTGRIEVGANGVSGGNAGYSVRGSINAPIIEDKVAILASGYYRQDPRWTDNIFRTATASNVNKKDIYGGRGAILLKPTENLSITLSGLYQRQNTANSDLAITSGGIRICPECQGAGNTAVTNYKPLYNDLSTLNVVPSTGISKYQLYTARVEWDIGFGTLTSISAWGRADNMLNNDVTSTFGGLFNRFYGTPASSTIGISNADHTHKFSQEVRLGGQVSNIDWLVGGFYTVEHASTDQTLTYTSGGNATPYMGSGPATYREYAAFADATLHATDKLDLQVGGRYAHNRQNATQALTIDGPVVPVFGPSSSINARSSEGAFTWLVSPSYHFSRDLMAYARVASGYRPGGPNLGSTNFQTSFGSDRVINYEIGFKGYVVPSVLSLDVSLFQIDWKNIQLQNTDAVSQLTFTTNGSKARSRGVELQAQARPWKGFTLDANGTYTDAVLTRDLPTPAGVTGLSGRSGDRLPFSAKFTTSFSAQQNFDLTESLTGFVGGTYSYIGSRKSAFITNAPSATRPRFDLPGYSQVEFRGGVIYDRHWQLNVYIRNAFNKYGVIVAQNRNGTNVPTAIFTQPRTIGFTLARDF